MNSSRLAAALLAIVTAAIPALAQDATSSASAASNVPAALTTSGPATSTTSVPAASTTSSTPTPTATDKPLQAFASPDQNPPVLSGAASGAYDRHDAFPNINLYLPEGQASARLRKLIRNVLFETQIDYRFITGDISTFLRYKYYAHNFTYRLGVFDEIGFPDVGSHSTKEFERVRGGLLLFELPRNYNNRYYWLLQDDRLTFGDPLNIDNRKNNIYTKLGYQYGTEFDERMNAIVGESRGRITPVLTAFRELGPQKFSLAAALTESAKIGTGDYKYTKLETEALKRTDLTSTTFLVSRLHGGIFPTKSKCHILQPSGEPCPIDPIESYTIPRYEMFALGGRDALRSVGDQVQAEGINEVHLTNEYFVPVFRNRDYRTYLLHWNTMYAIAYAGAGSVGFDYGDVLKSKNLVVDAGIGSEMSLTVRDLDILFSVLYAHGLHAPDGLKGSKFRFSIRTIR